MVICLLIKLYECTDGYTSTIIFDWLAHTGASCCWEPSIAFFFHQTGMGDLSHPATGCGPLCQLTSRGAIMFLKKVPFKETGRVFLEIAQGYRDKDGKSKTKIIEKIGFVDELMKTIPDPIAHFDAYAKELDAKRKESKAHNIRIDFSDVVERGAANVRNYGYIAISKIYHELGLDRLLNNLRRHERFQFNSESIMRLLAYSRVIYPHSKKKTFEIKDRFFENFDFSIDDTYNCLTHFSKIHLKVQKHVYDKVQAQYGVDTSLIYYDVTNYYFETDNQDDMRKAGYSKEGRRSPIIQMGLAMDSRSIPMAFRLFPGNKHDCETYVPSLSDIKKEFNVDRAIVIADKGLNCGDNIAFNVALGDGYIFSQSIRGGSDELKGYVLNPDGYGTPDNEGFKAKSRIVPSATVKITAGVTKSGRKSKKTVPIGDQKQVVFYSPKYAKRAKKQREEMVKKAQDLINNPSKYTKATHYGAAAYVLNIQFDKNTGLIPDNMIEELKLDLDLIADEEKYDGYYAIITSEVDASDADIIGQYRGLWKIEQSFRITKSLIRTRPVFVYRYEHIEGHFLVCFLALLLVRLIELRLKGMFSVDRIVETLRRTTCCHLQGNTYLFNFADELTDALNEELGTDFGKKFMSLAEIRSSIAATKKADNLDLSTPG